MWDRLPDIVCRMFPAVFAKRDGLRMSGVTPEFVICDLDSARHIPTDSAVIIFKDIQPAAPTIPDVAKVVAIVDSENKALVEQVSATKLPAITCGLSPRDTLTLSSIDLDSAVLSLQRTVTCFDGSVAEPQEIPVKLDSPMDSFTLMAAASIFIVSGHIDQLKSTIF